MFPLIQKNEQKQLERETQEKIKRIEGFADKVLHLLSSEDLDLSDASLVLQAASQKLNREGSKMKLKSVFNSTN